MNWVGPMSSQGSFEESGRRVRVREDMTMEIEVKVIQP